ncbi:hypothetical protein [Paracoccus yeei]|uniref:hypothetical protein n=1 Tax=Paracoccus yeei TaxID=147645 RepID=UPI00174E927F|nr:hypothetical protein [Paracoccus yeei]
MNTNYERYGHLGVPMNPTHTSAALDAAHELTKDLTKNIRTVRALLHTDKTVTLNTALAAFRADAAGQLIDELRTNLADLLSVCLPEYSSDIDYLPVGTTLNLSAVDLPEYSSDIDYLPVGTTLNLSGVDLADIESLRKTMASRMADEEFEVIEDVFDPDHDDEDLTEDDGWHFGGVITATPDGVVVSEADPDERDELVICF